MRFFSVEEAELDADFLWRLLCFFFDFLLWCSFDFLLWRFFLVFLPFLLEGRFFLAARLLSPLLLLAELSVSEEELESLLDSIFACCKGMPGHDITGTNCAMALLGPYGAPNIVKQARCLICRLPPRRR